MNQPPTVRLHLYLASDAERGVILRQGPSRHFCMIGWNTRTDTFEVGQWVKHKIYTERCDISPDGKHFLYFILDGRWKSPAKGSYTVISRVPYFTALSLYPQGDTWGGGGYFRDSTGYHIHTYPWTKDIVGLAEGLKRITRAEPASTVSFLKSAIGSVSNSFLQRVPVPEPADQPILVPEKIAALRDRLNMYHTDSGLLYRCDENGEQKLIGDFSDMSFQEVIAPYKGGIKE